MFTKRNKWCHRQWWNWGRAPFRTDHSKYNFQLTLSAIALVFISLVASEKYEYGSGGQAKSPSASNVYKYHIEEVLFKNWKGEGVNVLLKDRIRQRKKQENSRNISQTGYLNGESKVVTFTPVPSSHFSDGNANFGNYGYEVPTKNGDVHDFDGNGGSLNSELTEMFEQADHDSPLGIVQKKEFKHYLPIISIGIVYLLISVLVLGAALMPEDQCSTKDMDMSVVNWNVNPRRRFVPGRPVDPYLQVKLFDLFHGYDENDDEDESDELSDIGMNPGYLASELSFINSLCPTQAFFFSLSPRHIQAFAALKRLFLAQSSPEEVISLAKYLLRNKKVHPKVWYIALTQARLARSDMAGFSLAHPLDAIPDWYIPGDMLMNKWEKSRGRRRNMRSLKDRAIVGSRSGNLTLIGKKRKQGKGQSRGIKKVKRKRPHLPRRNLKDDYPRRSSRGGKKGCITVDGNVGIDNGIENELWYWREDIMLNQHHWYWHQAHPPNSTQHEDRRAELFYYMHRIFIARYNAERLSNGMARVLPLRMRRGALIPEGYNSHLVDVNSGIYWTPRAPDTRLQDALHANNRDLGEDITLRNYTRFRRRLVTSMLSGRLLSEGGELVSINNAGGIEDLTNTVEASDLSVNPMFYGSQGIHTLGHTLIGFAADPDFRLGRVTGIMSDGALSMRDPSFYSYHHFLDNFFELHKQRLRPYRPTGGDFPLLWSGVEVVNVELNSKGGEESNELRTFWTHHKFELSPGVDGSINTKEHPQVCAQHLDHEPFHFKIVVDRKPCAHSGSGKATVRIFMAPRYDEEGVRIPVQIQRRLMFPLDSFPVKLKVGRNMITRYAEDSSLTQPWTKSLQEFKRGPNPSGAAEFCGCGWPQHLYIPKGNPAGMAFDLFVMVTNYDEDHVSDDSRHPETCNSPFIFCGLPRRRYPDKRPMGYPFDRPLYKAHNCPPGWSLSSGICKVISAVIFRPFETLEQYVSLVPNMAMAKFHIKHLNRFLPEPANH